MLRGLLERRAMPPRDPRGGFAYVSDDVAGQVVADRRAARTRDRQGRGGRGRATHLDLAGRNARRHVARLQGAAARARRRQRGRGARGSCGRSRPTISPTTSASRRTASSIWISSGADRSLAVHDARTLRPRARPCRPTPRRSTSPSTPTHSVSHVASGESGTLRTYRLADAQAAAHAPRDDRLLQRLRAERPRGHAVARRRQADAARLARPAQRAPRAARARRLHRRR